MKVELRGISKNFGKVRANQDISITIPAGAIVGLLGENGAGKSTLVKILSGFISSDRGEIWLDDRLVQLKSPAHAVRSGIGMLHQDPLDFAPLTVLDNFMTGQSNRFGRFWLDRKTAKRQLKQLGQQYGFTLAADRLVAKLSVGERQQLEILRLLSLGVNTLILDEPTTGISLPQKLLLFATIRELAAAGKSIIFVSHKLEDVETLCDRVVVMRQGRIVGELNLKQNFALNIKDIINISPQEPGLVNSVANSSSASTSDASTSEQIDQLVEMMFGRELAVANKPETAQADPSLRLEAIEVRSDRLNLSIKQFTAQQGEVIGLAGLEGNGQRLLLLLCAGLLTANSGHIYLGDTNMTNRTYQQYLRTGVSYIPADRLAEGLVGGLSIQEHFALRSIDTSGSTLGRTFINWRNTLAKTHRAINTYNIRGFPTSRVEQLSGGNQQRTQLALLAENLNLLLMEHPTRGLDIDSAQWVWQQMVERCRQGTTILFISADLDEIMQWSDRVLVFSGGQVTEPIATKNLTVDRLGQMIGGKF
ncbi:nucleoside ABC transporter ATP-binding protein [Thalassoporum mexicanum PCC 7367]|uniref:ABC transporter ATP-binding protein n=1 Tax=Thalassoporum mexicanum TaxID=3457544 RepID=UPI00029FD0BF|nr:ATP-binding cassette domain-containing protein [Pseudanabaena sp. PCC 7367]AFY69855.1 nucleoside ABC transporter ATP-binding protein [Pseudanabaena sp. PCC 7367]